MANAFGAFLKLEPDQYLAGNWDFDLNMQLRWRRPDPEPGKAWGTERSGPSWSWASLTGPVIFDHPRPPCETTTLKIGECAIERKSEGFKYGEVLWARLTVSGNLCVSIRQGSIFIGWHPYSKGPFVLPLVANWDCTEERPSKVWCLEVEASASREGKKSSGLLLAKLDDKIYKRIGYFKFCQDEIEVKVGEWNWFRSEASYQTIQIE